MAGILERLVRHRKTEILITAALFVFALGLLFWSLGPQKDSLGARLAEKLSFALLVALIVRWVSVWFSEGEPREDSSHTEYHEAIKRAQSRIWICQTWLPGVERDATEVLQSNASDIRILLASFKDKSPIFARISGRKIEEAEAKTLVKNSIKPFLEKKSGKVCLRFNSGHHPAWIAVVDSVVFWGPTPVHVDNQSIDFLFHRHACSGAKGAFWTAQFERLWRDKGLSHEFDVEKSFNRELAKLDADSC